MSLVFRDWLVARGLTGSSVTRNFSYVKAVINFALSEFALDIRNPFVGVYHDRSKGVVTRKPIPLDALRHVQRECVQIDDDIRWLVSLVSDTGMRLAEAAGLSMVTLTFRVTFLSWKYASTLGAALRRLQVQE